MKVLDLAGGIIILRQYYVGPDQESFRATLVGKDLLMFTATPRPALARHVALLRRFGWFQPEAESDSVYDPDCDWAVKL